VTEVERLFSLLDMLAVVDYFEARESLNELREIRERSEGIAWYLVVINGVIWSLMWFYLLHYVFNAKLWDAIIFAALAPWLVFPYFVFVFSLLWHSFFMNVVERFLVMRASKRNHLVAVWYKVLKMISDICAPSDFGSAIVASVFPSLGYYKIQSCVLDTLRKYAKDRGRERGVAVIKLFLKPSAVSEVNQLIP
jgi:hypothetical protein